VVRPLAAAAWLTSLGDVDMAAGSVPGRAVGLLPALALLMLVVCGCAGRPVPVESFRTTAGYTAVATPERVRIPAAHVDTALERLRRAADGTLGVPSRWDTAGWYADGPRPGQPGPAVIVGHVDSTTGPAVFFHLSTLRPGDAVYVDRADGSTVAFRVTSVSRVPANRFPTDIVYAPTLEASLRLLTCGGIFDSNAKQYQDNVIVFAEPA
jgi:hypothetical protein